MPYERSLTRRPHQTHDDPGGESLVRGESSLREEVIERLHPLAPRPEGHQVFREKWVVVCEKPYGLIGRDLLNSYVLTCDGPGAYWKVEPNWL